LGLRERESNRRLENITNEELHNLYSVPNIVRVIISSWMEWEEYVDCMGGIEKCAQNFDRVILKKRPHGKCRKKWDDKY
jgi:hypothetical protein